MVRESEEDSVYTYSQSGDISMPVARAPKISSRDLSRKESESTSLTTTSSPSILLGSNNSSGRSGSSGGGGGGSNIPHFQSHTKPPDTSARVVAVALLLPVALAVLFASIGIGTEAWASGNNNGIDSCEGSLDVECSLYDRSIDGAYICTPIGGGNTTTQVVTSDNELNCDSVGETSAECTDLESAQNAAGIAVFLCSVALVCIASVVWLARKRSVQVTYMLLLGTIALEISSAVCCFITLGAYRNYLEAASIIDVYSPSITGDPLYLGTIDVEWTFGPSWQLFGVAGGFCILAASFTSCTYASRYYEKLKRAKEQSLGIQNTFGISLITESPSRESENVHYF